MDELVGRQIEGPLKTGKQLRAIMRKISVETPLMTAGGFRQSSWDITRICCVQCSRTIKISVLRRSITKGGAQSSLEVLGVRSGSVYIDGYSGLCKEHAREEILRPYLERSGTLGRKD